MKVEEAAKLIASVDRRLRDGKAVDDADRSVNLSALYRRYSWGAPPCAIPDDAASTLRLVDKSADDRWRKHFIAHARDIAVYRSGVGYYWLLRFERALGETYLDHVGTAADVAERFGDKQA